jgi:hypothetical protein
MDAPKVEGLVRTFCRREGRPTEHEWRRLGRLLGTAYRCLCCGAEVADFSFAEPLDPYVVASA